MPEDDPRLPTSIATATRDEIIVRDRNFSEEILGEMDFGSAVYLHFTGEEPTAGEARLTNMLFTVTIEHGMTPSAIVARLTHTASPEAYQAATASGLLGVGSSILGSMEPCARALQGAVPYEDVTDAAADVVEATDDPIPGLGHFRHKDGDPRSAKMFAVAEEEGYYGDHCEVLAAVQRDISAEADTEVPINAAGAVAAIGSDLGIDWQVMKSFSIVGRAAGLMAHIAEENETPIARDIWGLVDDHTDYQGGR